MHAFEAAARLGSFLKAAEELCITPSAVSHQIRSLEALLGIPLFHRIHRSVILTDMGRRYAEEVGPRRATTRLDSSCFRTYHATRWSVIQ